MSEADRLRVAVLARAVYPLHGYGGLERHVHDLVRHLRAREVDVTLITPRPISGRSPHDDLAGIDVEYVPYRTFPLAGRRGTTVLDRSTAYPLFGLAAGRRAFDLVRCGRADVVHGLGASALGYARLRDQAAAPLVLNPQGLEEFGATDPSRARLKRLGYFPLRLAVRRCARAADCVIATDRSLAPVVVKHLDVSADRVRVVPNAVDLDLIDRLAGPADGLRIRQRAGLTASDVVLVSAGRLESNKGFEVLAQALTGLRQHSGPLSNGGWRWVLVGDGPHRAAVTRAIAEGGLGDRVLMPGRLADAELHAWYEAATLFVHPTLYEGSSLVTLEAMAHRRAVVASQAGGLPDKIVPGLNGWLVAPGRPEALAGAISGALSDLPRLGVMGAASRDIVEREFAWPAIATRLVALYWELLARGGRKH